MLENAKEKEKRLDGSQCLKRKGTKEIKNVEKHIKGKRSNTYMFKLSMVVETLSCDNIDITTILLMLLIRVVSKLVDGQDASNKENMDPNETDDWLHRNDLLHAINIDDISHRISGNSTVVYMASAPTC